MLNRTLFTLFIITLVGCGGGSSGNEGKSTTSISNIPPSLSLTNISVKEKESVTITAIATDSDGTIQSYDWKQSSGIEVELSDTTTQSISFTAPSLTETSDLEFQLIVTDDDGANSTSKVKVSVSPIIMAEFTISGVVNTGDLKTNADITASLGDLLFETKTNEVGRYTINITVDDDYQDHILNIMSADYSESSALKLISTVGYINSISNLAEQNNDELSENELSALNVNEMSTAASALMIQNNTGEIIDTEDEYNASTSEFSSEHLLTYAAMIKYIFNNISLIPESILPEDFSNTFDYLTDSEKASELYYAINRYQPSILNELIDDFSKSSHFLSSVLDLPENESILLQEGKLTMLSDGTGTLISSLLDYDDKAVGAQPLTWQIIEKSIVLTFDSPIAINSDSLYHSSYGEIYYKEYLSGYTVNSIFQNKTRSELLVISQRELRNTEDNSLINNDIFGISYRTNLVNNHKLFSLKTALGSLEEFIHADGNYIFSTHLPNYEKHTNSYGHLITITESYGKLDFSSINSSTVNIELPTFEFDQGFGTKITEALWQVNDNGSFVVSSPELTIEMTKLAGNDNSFSEVMTIMEQEIEGRNVKRSIKGALYKVNDALTWTNENVPGFYTYQNNPLDLDPLNVQWYELRNDGTVSFFHIDDDATGLLSTSNIIESPGLWRIIEGKLVVRRYKNKYANLGNLDRCHSTIWDPSVTADCVLWVERVWERVRDVSKESGKNLNIVVQHVKYFEDHRENFYYYTTLFEGRSLSLVSMIISNFERSEERPIELPEGYELIKDRVSATVNNHVNIDKKLESLPSKVNLY